MTPIEQDALAIIEEQARTIENLRAEIEAAENYLRDLLTTFVTEHFPNNESWKPLPDLLGMLSQMDNASTVARDYKAQIEKLRAEVGFQCNRAERAETLWKADIDNWSKTKARLAEAVEALRPLTDTAERAGQATAENMIRARAFLQSLGKEG